MPFKRKEYECSKGKMRNIITKIDGKLEGWLMEVNIAKGCNTEAGTECAGNHDEGSNLGHKESIGFGS